VDNLTPERRSWLMSRVRASDTTPELVVRRFLHKNGFRYGLHNKSLPGKPDIVLRKIRTVIFVHGCFWHGHAGCRKARLPKTRTSWWKQKRNYNIEKDNRNRKALHALGWMVITIWQCKLNQTKMNSTLRKVEKKLRLRLLE
jgi:DNA mismatch endonuclease (patch repair protein)